MIPDYDYTLLVPRAAQSAVIDALRLLCSSDSSAALTNADQPNPVDVAVSFRSLPDMPADVVHEFPRLPDGGHGMGNVYLTVKPSRWSEFPHAVEFRLWPSTRRLQRAIIGSRLLRNELIRVLERCGGHAGYVVNESCAPVEFWHESAGRSNDGHPPEYVGPSHAEPSAADVTMDVNPRRRDDGG
jgi:hypothetical protein